MLQKFSQSALSSQLGLHFADLCICSVQQSAVSHGNSLKIINCCAKLVIPFSNYSKQKEAASWDVKTVDFMTSTCWHLLSQSKPIHTAQTSNGRNWQHVSKGHEENYSKLLFSCQNERKLWSFLGLLALVVLCEAAGAQVAALDFVGCTQNVCLDRKWRFFTKICHSHVKVWMIIPLAVAVILLPENSAGAAQQTCTLLRRKHVR